MMLSDWILSIEGTPAGAQAAMILALVAAVAHASLGALQKGRHDPWLSRGAVDIWVSVLSLPLAVFLVPVPSWDLAILLPGAMLVHLAFKWIIAMAYTRGAFTAVYPVVRGTGPLVTVVVAGLVFGEVFSPGQWLGIAVLCGAIFSLAAYNLAQEKIDPGTLRTALALAVLTGILTALYTVYDAYAIRIAEDPLTFIVWFFLLEATLFPVLIWRRWRGAGPILSQLVWKGFYGAIFAYLSFGTIFIATRLDKVGEAAALRETSVIFAALIGWLILGEKIGWVRSALMVAIAAGAILVEFG